MKNLCFAITLLLNLAFAASLFAADSHVLKIKGKKGPGAGKKVVLVAGDEEYRTEESMPMLAKILSKHHGFDTAVVFSWDPEGKYIDPNNQEGLIGLAELDDADLMIIGTRFRKPSPEEAKHLTDFLNAGKPVIGIRTSTHAFNGDGTFGGTLKYGEFGLSIIGEKWVSHHGKHKKEGARSVVEEGQGDHAILRGVDSIFGPSDVYGVIHLTDADTILLRGVVTDSLEPDSKPIEGEKNDPMMPLAWIHPYTAPNGTTEGRTFCTTMGASVDFSDANLRRLIVNAALFLTGLEVPSDANVDPVDPFYPSFYGFIREKGYWASMNLTLDDVKPGAVLNLPDPSGSPEFKARDRAPETRKPRK